jgi:hypothetical protein
MPSKTKPHIFAIGDRVRPTSGPYRRTEFEVVGIEGDASTALSNPRLTVQSGKLNLAFPSKLLKPAPKPKNKALFPEKAVMDEPKTTHPPSRTALRKPKNIETSLPSPRIDADFKVGDTVHFEQYWNGERTAFEGTIARLGEPVGTAIVHFQAPEGDRILELQSPIGVFSLTPLPKSPKFAVGDRVAGAWDEEITGTVEQVFDSGKVAVRLDGERSLRVEFFLSALVRLEPKPQNTVVCLPPESDPLFAQIAAIREEGAIAPSHCWIERKVHACGFTEAVFKSRTAIFTGKSDGLCKSQYIGKWESPAHSEAIAAVDRRNRIEKLQKQLEKIEKMQK